MSDSISAYIVTLKRPIKDETAKAFAQALRLFENVAAVEPVVQDVTEHVATMRVRSELAERLWHVLHEKAR